jgi:hypothetical protein
MPSKKNQGQQWLGPVQEGVERSFENRPKGMPSLAVIKQETAKLGLPDSDAEHLYDVWLRDDFKTARGTRIRNWHAAVRIWFRSGWFPSQKAARNGAGPHTHSCPKWQPPTKELILEYCKKRRYSHDWGLKIYRLLVARNWKYFGEPVTSDEQWKAICDTHPEQ